MLSIFKFLNSTAGRATRAVAGLILIGAGLFAVGGTVGYVIAAIGLVPLAAGVFDLCLFAPLFGLPISGSAVRGKLASRA